jgi:quinol monooxygenase YgiN
MATIKIDPNKLDNYTKALKEQMAAAIEFEPGVLSYYAVSDKMDPSKITIIEIYADTSAYKSHINTSHFRKYKETVKDMVTSLELKDLILVGSVRKPGM